MKSRRILPKMVLLLLFSLVSLISPAWSGGYTVEQLFLLPLDELMGVAVEMAILP